MIFLAFFLLQLAVPFLIKVLDKRTCQGLGMALHSPIYISHIQGSIFVIFHSPISLCIVFFRSSCLLRTFPFSQQCRKDTSSLFICESGSVYFSVMWRKWGLENHKERGKVGQDWIKRGESCRWLITTDKFLWFDQCDCYTWFWCLFVREGWHWFHWHKIFGTWSQNWISKALKIE